MWIYAERPLRLLRQLVGDVLVVGWVWLFVWLARTVNAAVLKLQEPAQQLVGAGAAIRGAFESAAGTAGQVPFVGADLAAALSNGTGAGQSLEAAGQQQVEFIGMAATGIAVAIVLFGLLPVLTLWLPARLRYARLAASARAARSTDCDLLALRAIANRPVRRLRSVSPTPAAAWRDNDESTISALAALELRSLGLRAPRKP